MRRGILTRYLANQSGFICATSKGGKEEEKENKSAGKPFEKSEEEKRCGNACSKSRLIVSHDEIFTRDYNSPTLRDARSILGAPNDTYEHLSDIKDHGKVSGVKWPPNIRVCNGRRVSKVISKNAEENSYDAMDKMPKVFSLKSFKNIPNKASAILRVKKKSASSNLRGKKLIAVKGCFTKRKKVAKCHKKKITYGKKKDTDNEVGISRYSDDVTVAGKGNNNEQIEKFDKFFCEPSGSQDLTKCSSKCRNIMKTKSNDRSFSEIGMKTEPSTKTFKTAKNNSSQSEKEEWEDLSQRNKKILEKFKPKTTLDSFPNEKVSSPIPRGRQIQRDKEISSVMTIWHWLRRRHRVRGAAVPLSASAKQRTQSLYNGSSVQDVKDPFLSLFFPLIAGSGFLMSTGKAPSGAKDHRNL